jgi:hypothetical protein
MHPFRLALPPPLLEKLAEPAAEQQANDASVKTMSEPMPIRSDSAEGTNVYRQTHRLFQHLCVWLL